MKHELTNITYEGYSAAKAQLNIERIILEGDTQAMTYHSVAAYLINDEGEEVLGKSQYFNFNFIYEGGNINEEALTKLGAYLSRGVANV